MRAALARHDEILRDAVEAHDGVVFKTTGDGIARGVRVGAGCDRAAVLDAQQRLAPSDVGRDRPLRVRMGLHTGEGRLRDGDYYGPTVNRAARLMAVAHGGQVLVSDVTAAVVRERLPEGVVLNDLGEHRLRDLAEPVRVFQVVHPELRARLPAAAFARRVRREPAAAADGASSAARRELATSPALLRRVAAGHAHRRRRRGQDTPGAAARGGAAAALPRWRVARASSHRSRAATRYPTSSAAASACSASPGQP